MRKGRKARLAAPPVAKAVGPNMIGGAYKPLTDIEMDKINDGVMHVLEHIGMADPIPIVQEHALKRGCFMNKHGRLCYPRSLVEEVIANSPSGLQFKGQDPKFDLDLEGFGVNTYGGGEAVNMLDIGASKYRPSNLMDLYDVARLVDKMDNVHAFSRLIVATEIEDQLACDISTAYVSAAGTAKHTALTFNDASHVQPTLEMLHMMAGGEKKWLERPFMHGGG